MNIYKKIVESSARASALKMLNPKALAAAAVVLGMGTATAVLPNMDTSRFSEQVREVHVMPDFNYVPISFETVDDALSRTDDMTERDLRTALRLREIEANFLTFNTVSKNGSSDVETLARARAQLDNPDLARADLEKEILAYRQANVVEVEMFEADAQRDLRDFRKYADENIKGASDTMQARLLEAQESFRVNAGLRVDATAGLPGPERFAAIDPHIYDLTQMQSVLRDTLSAEFINTRDEQNAEFARVSAQVAEEARQYRQDREQELQAYATSTREGFDERLSRLETVIDDIDVLVAKVKALDALAISL